MNFRLYKSLLLLPSILVAYASASLIFVCKISSKASNSVTDADKPASRPISFYRFAAGPNFRKLLINFRISDLLNTSASSNSSCECDLQTKTFNLVPLVQ